MRSARREAPGWAAALAIAVIVVAQVASTARSDLLFRDGDSLVVALAARSVLEGQPWDWAFSSVLFLPELTVFLLLRMLLPGVTIMGVLAVNAVVNVLALYGAVRLAAGRRLPGRRPVFWSVAALAAFGLLAITETSASRDALEPASLVLTTTYYSATVVGSVLTLGLVRRWIDARSSSPLLSVAAPAQARKPAGATATSRCEDGTTRRGTAILAAIGLVVAISTLTNPLFLAWAVAPIAVLLLFALRATVLGRAALLPLGVLVVGAGAGFAARIPFSAWITNTGAGYAQPELWMQSVGYYGELVLTRWTTPGGVAATILIGLLLAVAVRRSIRSSSGRREQNDGERLIAAYAWFAPLAVVLGAIALGTHAARYLEPIAFAPVLALAARPVNVRLSPGIRRAGAVTASALLVLGAAFSLPRIPAAVGAPDADATCVVDWVNASGRTGAGQFWTVRLPKLLLRDPAQLVQVDHTLRGYAWLVNRADFAVGEVTFLVEDAQTVPWQLTDAPQPDATIGCGRYRILDYASHPLPLGPQRS
ncbi:hypothetical protein Q9R19_09015 [Microbacterium sp. ARD32]|uniref:hypothetical protein n=1 Tax=Microbacterium sp. ARD32 TaxID=2962577 RepID=UPI00288297E9|nr:hypothetical protein [Microbacterium sp. ARD32]MDT0157763.1 hypothetical protein [Microbacterium sp. ARD32]